MSLALVNTTFAGNSGAGFSSTINAGSASHTTGNLLVVGIRWNAGFGSSITSIDDTAMNSYSQAVTLNDANADGLAIWYAKNITGNSNNVVTVTFSSGATNFADIIVFQYSGADTSAPLDTSASGSANSSSVTSGSFTTSQAAEVLVQMMQIASLSGAWTPGSGYGNLLETTNKVSGMADQIVSSIQTSVTSSASNTQSTDISICVATFKEAGGGGTTQSYTVVKGDLAIAGQTDPLANAFGTVKGNLTLTGYASPLSDAFKIAKGDLTLTGQTIAYSQGQQFTLVKGDLTLTGSASPLTDAFKIAKGDLTLTGQIISMGATQSFTLVKGDLTLTGQTLSLNFVQSFTLVKGNLTLTGYAVTFTGGTNVTWSAVNPASGIWTDATLNTSIWTEATN